MNHIVLLLLNCCQRKIFPFVVCLAVGKCIVRLPI